jgi:hypothetical protein
MLLLRVGFLSAVTTMGTSRQKAHDATAPSHSVLRERLTAHHSLRNEICAIAIETVAWRVIVYIHNLCRMDLYPRILACITNAGDNGSQDFPLIERAMRATTDCGLAN